MNTVVRNSFKAIEINAEYRGQQVVALVHVVERPITVYYETQTKPFGEVLLIALA